MAEAKYNSAEHKRRANAYAQAIAAGQGWCTEPICLIEQAGGTRYIPPGTPRSQWHVPHNEDGTTYRDGPAHRRCNIGEGNTRRKAAKVRRLIL